jgi:hypothetical protein
MISYYEVVETFLLKDEVSSVGHYQLAVELVAFNATNSTAS